MPSLRCLERIWICAIQIQFWLAEVNRPAKRIEYKFIESQETILHPQSNCPFCPTASFFPGFIIHSICNSKANYRVQIIYIQHSFFPPKRKCQPGLAES